MANRGNAKIAGRHGPLRTPMAASGIINKGPLHPPTGANTTIPGSAPKSAPIRSPLQGQPLKGFKSK
jgi:hypothetical protein